MQQTQRLLIRREKQGLSLAEYAKIHHWLKKHYGVAIKCKNTKCRGKSENFSWALRPNETYNYKREVFYQLCYSCHALADMTLEGRQRLAELYKGRRLPDSAYGTPRTQEWNHKISKSQIRNDKCRNGHPRTEEDTYWLSKVGYHQQRECRVCSRERKQEYRFRQLDRLEKGNK